MEYKDYYQVMGLARDATADEVRKAYRKLARKYHPDVSKETGAEAKFKELGEAYEVLKDPEKRAAYDQLGTNWKTGQDFRAPPDWNAGQEASGAGFDPLAGQDFSDFFETLFRRGFSEAEGGGARAAASEGGFHAHGEDRHATIQIDLEDAYNGGARTLSLRVPDLDAQGRMGAAGPFPRQPHRSAQHEGSPGSAREHQIEFVIPKGVRAGQHIRLAGQGSAGVGQGKAGDLYLEVEFRPHAHYRVELRDVFMDLPVTPWEAALGAQVEAPTPTGTVEVTVPAGSTAGRKLRLKGRGIPGKTPGDFYFVLQIAQPPADTDKARAAYAEMATQFAGFQPRSKLGSAI